MERLLLARSDQRKWRRKIFYLVSFVPSYLFFANPISSKPPSTYFSSLDIQVTYRKPLHLPCHRISAFAGGFNYIWALHLSLPFFLPFFLHFSNASYRTVPPLTFLSNIMDCCLMILSDVAYRTALLRFDFCKPPSQYLPHHCVPQPSIQHRSLLQTLTYREHGKRTM